MAGATAGLIPDALPGVQGAAFVCLLALGVLSQEEGQGAQAPFLLPPALPPPPPSYSVHQLVPTQTHPRPVEMPAWVAGNAHPHPKAWNAETSTFSLADPSLSARQIGWRSIASPCRQGN